MFVPLRGVRILDLTRLLPGPFCSWILSSLGADVLRLEDPNGGDYTRYLPPAIGRHGAMFHVLNRGKRSIVVDLRADGGAAVVHDLLDHRDVLLEGFRPGTLARLGLDPDELRRRHPGLVVCSISGYGQDGPRASRAGHDLNYQALAGVLALTGEAGGPPAMPGLPLADLTGAMQGALGIVAALLQRERTGEGAWIDVAMTESVAALAAPLRGMDGFPADDRRGGAMLNGGLACYNVYRTRDDRHLAVAALEPKFWAGLCAAVDHPEWASLAPVPGPEQAEVAAGLAGVFAGRTLDEWTRIFDSHDLCVEPVLSPAAAPTDAHAGVRGRVVEEGGFRWSAPPLGQVPAGDSPAAGEHTDSALAEIGYSGDRIAELRRSGVIG
jgi:alpha-methylacyl-CoA racemase